MLSQIGALTSMGILYEGGDFAAWKERFRTHLHAQGLDLDHMIASSNRITTRIADRRSAILNATVSKSMLMRLPPFDRLQTKALLELLEARAKPFRLLDLPAELRNNIYSLSLSKRILVQAADDENRSKVPQLLQSCSDIRKEAAPIYFGKTSFRFQFNHRDHMLDFDQMTQLLRSWAEQVVGERLKHIRDIRLVGTDEHGSRWDHVAVCWSTLDGLTIKFAGTPALKARVDHHGSEASATGKALGLGGGTIIAFLTTNTELWRHTTALLTVEEIKAAMPQEGMTKKAWNTMFWSHAFGRQDEMNKLCEDSGVRCRRRADGVLWCYPA